MESPTNPLAAACKWTKPGVEGSVGSVGHGTREGFLLRSQSETLSKNPHDPPSDPSHGTFPLSSASLTMRGDHVGALTNSWNTCRRAATQRASDYTPVERWNPNHVQRATWVGTIRHSTWQRAHLRAADLYSLPLPLRSWSEVSGLPEQLLYSLLWLQKMNVWLLAAQTTDIISHSDISHKYFLSTPLWIWAKNKNNKKNEPHGQWVWVGM